MMDEKTWSDHNEEILSDIQGLAVYIFCYRINFIYKMQKKYLSFLNTNILQYFHHAYEIRIVFHKLWKLELTIVKTYIFDRFYDN